MAGVCADGIAIDQKVRSFQIHRGNDDYLMIEQYYDDYKEYWFRKVSDLIEKEEFDCEWCRKLLHALETYQESKAIMICRLRGWAMDKKFNRWFYSALRNWISNIKAQAYRAKQMPGIMCPVCLKEVGKIDERHLQHIKTTKDLPKVFFYQDEVYKTYLKPRKRLKKYLCSLNEALQNPRQKGESIEWPWFVGKKPMVVCPFMKVLISELNDQYILTLPHKYKHYAKSMNWFEFQDEHPNFMVHSEIKSLDYQSSSPSNDQIFIERIHIDKRIANSNVSYMSIYASLNNISMEFEHALKVIETCVQDNQDQKILKYIVSGYEIKDICEVMDLPKKDVKRRMSELSENKQLERMLLKVVMKS